MSIRDNFNDFVGNIVGDPNNPPKTALLRGFLGESCDEGCVRLYFDPEFCHYVEIPEDDILHVQPISDSASSLGGNFVWVNRQANLTLPRKPAAPNLTANYLRGNLMSRYRSELPGSIGGEEDWGKLIEIQPSWIDGCPSEDPIIPPVETRDVWSCSPQCSIDWRTECVPPVWQRRRRL